MGWPARNRAIFNLLIPPAPPIKVYFCADKSGSQGAHGEKSSDLHVDVIYRSI